MKLIRLCVQRPVGTVMFFVGVLLLGYVSLRKLSVELLPSLSYPKLSVLTEYPGAAPEEVEKMVTEPLESELSSIPSLRRITSSSREGISLITLEFHWGTNMDFALLHAKEKIEEASQSLPSDCSKPTLLQWDPSSRPIIIAVLSGGKVEALREMGKYLIKPRLERLKGVARVEVRGGGEPQVIVSLDPGKMAELGIGFQDVEKALSSYDKLILGGTVMKNRIRYVVKVEGELRDPSQINEIPVKFLKKRAVLLKDVGRAYLGEAPLQGEIRFNRKRAVALLIFKQASANTLKVSQRVLDEMERMEKEFPGLKFKLITQDAALIKSSMASLKYSILLGSLLAFLVLVLFLRNIRDPILVALVIPIAVISTFVLMFFARVNLNIMSLGGLALGVGMFVDNSIVVLESMFRHRREKPPEEAAVDGASEVAGAITAATFTTIVIFLPVIYIYGVAGRLFRDLAFTVTFSLLSSLLVSLTLLPSMFALLSGGKKGRKTAPEKEEGGLAGRLHRILSLPFLLLFYLLKTLWRGTRVVLNFTVGLLCGFFSAVFTPLLEAFSSLYRMFEEKYHEFLSLCFEKRAIPLGITLVMLVFILVSYPLIRKELLPNPSTDKYEISARTPFSYGFSRTNRVAGFIEQRLMEGGAGFVFSQIGAVSKIAAPGQDISVNGISMIVGGAGRKGAMEVARRLLSSFYGLRFSVFPERNAITRYLSLGAEAFKIKVFYADEEAGKQVAGRVIRALKGVKGLRDLRTNAFYSKPLLAMKFREEVLKALGIEKEVLATTVEAALRGRKVMTIRRFQRNYDVVITSPFRERKKLEEVLALPISVKGRVLPLRNLVEVEERASPAEITREGQERFFLISADLVGSLGRVSRRVEEVLSSLHLPPGVRIRISGVEEERRRAFRSLYSALFLAVLLVYMVMASQFENLIHPLIIMLTIPMGLFGGFLLLLLSGGSINVISGIGFMVMAGIVVNDAIVKVDYANKLRRKGLAPKQAMMEASKVRLRPILMTTFTTVFGLLPMALLKIPGSELQRPLAVVVIGSLLASTFLTLVLIPVLYEMVEK